MGSLVCSALGIAGPVAQAYDMWNSWLVLAACAVITQSLPRPDGAYLIPAVPANKRVQYYVLHDDGTFKYGHDTGAGAYESAMKVGDLTTGAFGFTDAESKNVRVDYTAGVGGFVPTISHTDAEIPVEVAQPVEYSANNAAVVPTIVPVEPRGDASYSFAYVTGDSDREETSDANLNVHGKYAFVAPDGVRRVIAYKAGSATGFVAEGAHLPVAPVAEAQSTLKSSVSSHQVEVAVPTPTKYAADAASVADINSVLNADGSYRFSYNALSSSRDESADSDLNVKGSYTYKAEDGSQRTVNYIAGSDTGFVATGSDVPVPVVVPVVPVIKTTPVVDLYSAPPAAPTQYSAPSHTAESSATAEASYNFEYNTGDSERKESADADLNVEGSFSFTADDGVTRTVRYRAGSGIGFLADGTHLPVANDLPSSVAAAQATQYSANTAGVEEATAAFINKNLDASYDFGYSADKSERKESADADLNVKGSFSFVADDGVLRTVEYIAGSATGFVATGAHLPAAEEAPVATHSVDVETPAQPAAPTVYTATSHTAETAATVESTADTDASYKFEYKTGDSERKESADADLNVEGSFSFTAADGVTRTVRYRAGSETGFIADGTHLPVAHELTPATGVQATQYSANTAGVEEATAAFINQNLDQDASYNFGYSTSESDRKESADNDLNVKGSFSFVADDGIRRTVEYIAGSTTGFVATGAHLPVAEDAAAATAPLLKTAAPIRQVLPVAPVVVPAVAHVSPLVKTSDVAVEKTGDSSYSFNYQNNHSSRDETADSELNVKGSYKFVADDGVERSVKYTAGSSTGFVAEGAHLPTPVVAAAVPEVAVPSLKSSVSSTSSAKKSHYTDEAALSSRGSVALVPGFRSVTSNQPDASVFSTHHSARAGTVVGNVLLHQYDVKPGKSKFGYAFSAI